MPPFPVFGGIIINLVTKMVICLILVMHYFALNSNKSVTLQLRIVGSNYLINGLEKLSEYNVTFA